MQLFFEAVGLALSAIWANKLRSFLTVLGNIVAVTSIIAVVSLIQGMNGYVTNAIVSGVGADNFTIQRYPVVRTAGRRGADPRATRGSRWTKRRPSGSSATTSAPWRSRLTRADAPNIATSRSTRCRFRACRATTSSSRRSPPRRGRLISSSEVDRIGAGCGARGRHGRPAVQGRRAARQDDQARRAALPRHRRQREEGVVSRPVAGRVRDHPARHLPEDVRRAARTCS